MLSRGLMDEPTFRLDDELPTCQAPGCPRLARRAGLCSGHYWRRRNGLPLDTPIGARAPRKGSACVVEGCGRKRYSAMHCRAHHRQLAAGKPLAPVKRYVRMASVGPLCRMPGCLLKKYRRGLCPGHYRRLLAGEDVNVPVQGQLRKARRVGNLCLDPAVYKAVRLNAKKQGVRSGYGAVRLALEEWFREYVRNKDPDFCRFDRGEAPRADGWAQSPNFSPDEE